MSELRPPLWNGLTPAEFPAALGDPPDRYRPVPWLAWTGELDWHGLRSQLVDMRRKGITEFFLFPIYGMEFPYMSAAYWERVGQTLDFCRDHGMKCWIYDEYNWPSGPAAGMVMRDFPEAREKLLWLRFREEGEQDSSLPPGVSDVIDCGGAQWSIATGDVLRTSVRGGDWVSQMPGYIDIMKPEACRRFIETTHEKYLQRAGEMFPDTIPGFFTDEPGFYHPRLVNGWLPLPYTDNLFGDFERRYGYDLREYMGELLFDGPTAQRTRCHYWRLASERFGEAFSHQIRKWCDEHGVALTGHCLGEEGLALHVRMSGDLWEALRHFTIPGIDMLANADGFTYPYRMQFYGDIDRRALHMTCKYVHGIVRHCGAREMMSEAYGVCDWGMNLFRQKRGFHYQVALGVTLFNDNSLITSIADFRKYAIAGKHFTQPWWQHYRLYADYNARLAALHAEGEPVADIAMLYPRSTVWANSDGGIFARGWYQLEQDHPLGILQELMYDILDELIREQWHFDFIFEPVLAGARVEGSELVTEHARYRAVVVPSAEWIPSECMDVLARFAAAGGRLIFAGNLPRCDVDTMADLSGTVQAALAEPGVLSLPASGADVSAALEKSLARPLVLQGDKRREFVSSWRRIAGSDVLFVASMCEEPVDLRIAVTVSGPVVICDPATLQYYHPAMDESACFDWHFEPWQGFLILTGDAAAAHDAALPPRPVWQDAQVAQVLDGPWEFELFPGNMLRLQVQARPDHQNSGAKEGWQHDMAQEGWVQPEGSRLPEAIRPGDAPWYWLRARVTCEPGARPNTVVLDNPDFLEVFVNGRPAEPTTGAPLWTEENLHFDVSDLFVEGENHIHVRARTSKYNDQRISPFPGITDRLLQPVVVVGDFRVSAEGSLTADSRSIDAAASWESQGVPHFAGVGIYRRTISKPHGDRTLLHFPACTDAVEVRVNGGLVGRRAWPPYVFDIHDVLTESENTIEIRVHNTLGNIITETYAGAVPPARPQSGLLEPPRLLG